MNYYSDPLLTKLRLIESGQQLNEGLSPEERKELDGLFKDLAGFDGVDADVSALVAQYKKLPKAGPTGGTGGAKLGRANPGTKAFQNWLNSKGQKVAVDGVYGPATQQAATALHGDPAYMDMVGVGTAYNVIPGQGLSLNSPEYLAKMKKYGYDPKTGDKIAGGSGAQPGAGAASVPFDKLNQLAPKAGPGTEFWVDGSRYEKSPRGTWAKTFEPGDWGWNSNQAKARASYTGPNDGEIDKAADQAKTGGAPTGAAAQPVATSKPSAQPVPGRPRGGA